jgi:hypothetical protein
VIYRPKDDVELSQIVSSGGDTILLRSGAVYSATALPAGLLNASDITLGISGSGELPLISGGVIRKDWVFDPVNNVYSRPAYASNSLGNVTEDGVPMHFTPWTTNLATTAALMLSGQSLPYWSGAMTYDPVARIVYIRPSSDTAAKHVYVVSETLNGLTNYVNSRKLLIEGIAFRSLSRHGVALANKVETTIRNCVFEVIGGVRPNSLWMGNGLELSVGTEGAVIEENAFYDIFDSCATTQLFEAVPAKLSDHHYFNNTCDRYGLTAIEVSCQTSNQRIEQVEIAGLKATNGQENSWSGDRGIGSVISFLCNGNSVVTRSFARDVVASRQRRSYIGYAHQGVCGIDSSRFTNTVLGPLTGQGPNGSQVDLIGAVSFDGTWTGSPSYSQADMRKTFYDFLC